ncbi:hypothetical protein PG994_004907 [Apiospora phragmitis]|uniref:Nephrocystin 3-like N-terminal domain-containing protein n=1 Tax=Apiospora phragmitis TaxID=2905665 RepID=A0ABR1VRY5_9PEZI
MSPGTVDIVIISIPDILSSQRDGSDYLSLHELLPGDFPQTRIIPLGPRSGSPLATLHDRATELLDLLSNRRKIDPYRPILFIAHSIGGLVVKVALVRAWREIKYRAIARSTRAIVFLGTPHRVTSLSKSLPASLVSYIGDIIDLVPEKGSPNRSLQWSPSSQCPSNLSLSLDELHRSWMKIYSTRLRVTTVYETVSPVVPKCYAVCNLPEDGEALMPMNTTHELLGYYKSRNDLGYRIISDRISWMLDWIHKSVPSRRDFGDDEYQILHSLWPEELVSAVYLISEPHKKTFSWIWQIVSMQSWLQSTGPSMYCITGKPGSGKSVMSRHIWDKLSSIEPDTVLSAQGSDALPILVAAHFTDFNFPPSSSESILRSLLHQVIALQPSLSKFLPSSLASWHYHGESHLHDLSCTLHHLARHSNILVIIDALDECHADVQRDTIEALYFDGTQISPEDLVPPEIRTACTCTLPRSTSGLKVMMSSRSHILEDLFARDAISRLDLSIGKPAQGLIHDAQHIIADRLELRWDIYRGVLTPIFDQLVISNRATGVFLWVSLVISSMSSDKHFYRSLPRRGFTNNTLKAFLPRHAADHDPTTYLSIVPTSLDELYQFVLDAVLRRQNKALVLKALTWVCLAQAPLSPVELFEAIGAVKPGVEQTAKCSRFQDLGTGMFLLGGLVEVQDSKVRLIHQTARDFLLGRLPLLWPLKRAPVSRLRGKYNDSTSLLHGELNIWCMDYLHTISHVENRNLNTESYELEQRWPLIQYAATHWRQHQVKARTVIPDDLTRRLFRPRSMLFLAWFPRWWGHECHNEEDHQMFPTYPTQGIVASFLGHEALIREWLELFSMKATEYTKYGWSAETLSTAAGRAVKARRKCSADIADSRLRRSIDIVRYLVQEGGLRDHVWAPEPTALHFAARKRMTSIASLLLQLGASNVDAVDELGRTPLQDASILGNLDMLRLLLSHGADLNIMDHSKHTALELASLYGRANVAFLNACKSGSPDTVRHFLQMDVSPSSDRIGIPALHHVLIDGVSPTATGLEKLPHQGSRIQVLRLLLDAGVSPDVTDHMHQTCLHRAARRSEGLIIRFLVSRGANVSVPDQYGRTPLDYASHNADLDAIEYLIQAGSVVTNTTWLSVLESGHSERPATCLVNTHPLPDAIPCPTSASSSTSLVPAGTADSLSAGSVGTDQNGAGTYELEDVQAEVDDTSDIHTSEMFADGFETPGDQRPNTDDPLDPDDTPPDQGHRHLIVKPGRFPVENIQISKSSTDKEFVNILREAYRSPQSRPKQIFSIYRFSHWGLDEFSHLNGVYHSESLGRLNEYYFPFGLPDYDFVHVDNGKPPISASFFHQHYWSCPADCDRCRFPRWCNALGSTDVEVGNGLGCVNYLHRTPKRYEKWERTSQDATQLFYGLTAFELPCFIGFCAYLLAAMSFVVSFLVYWFVLQSHTDVQNATVPLVIIINIGFGLYGIVGRPGWNGDLIG